MDGGYETRPTAPLVGRAWYSPLVGLYGLALILSNPFLAFGLYFVVLALWIVLAFIVLRQAPAGNKALPWALLFSVLIWVAAVIPSFLFVVKLATAMWYAGELASIFLATLVVSRSASALFGAGDPGNLIRRLGLGAGLSTALLMVLPIATYFIEDLEVFAIFHPIVFYLPYFAMLVTAAVATVCFALVPARRSGS